MPLWKRRRPRREASASDDPVTALILAQTGGIAAAGATAALETAAGLVSRSLSAAIVRPASFATMQITPAMLATAGRALVRNGESIWHLMAAPQGLRILPVDTWDVEGGEFPEDWTYRVHTSGPSSTVSRNVDAHSVLHFKWAMDNATPWIGRSALAYANETGNLLKWLEKRLAEEASGPTGSVIPAPDSGDDPDEDVDDPTSAATGRFAKLTQQLGKLRGGLMLTETMNAAYGEGMGSAPQQDWTQKRFGPNPPDSLRALRDDVYRHVLMACGIPPALSGAADGTAAREAYRQFLHTTLQPVADAMGGELSEKMGFRIRLDLSRLYAGDIAGRARAFQSLVKGGMDMAEAAAKTGLLMEDE